MIKREPKDAEHPYTMIDNGVFDDPDLSLKAKGLLAYLLSKPDDWKFYVDQLARCLKEHRNTIARIMQELIDAGYCERTEIRGKDGRFSGYDYDVYETKIRAQEYSTGHAQECSTVTVHKKRDTVNAALLNTDSTNDSLRNLEGTSKNSSSDNQPKGRKKQPPVANTPPNTPVEASFPCSAPRQADGQAENDKKTPTITTDDALRFALRSLHFDPPVNIKSFRPIYMKIREKELGVFYLLYVAENGRGIKNARHYVQAIKHGDHLEDWRNRYRAVLEDDVSGWFCNACLKFLVNGEACDCGDMTERMMFDEVDAALQQTMGDVEGWRKKVEREEMRKQKIKTYIKRGIHTDKEIEEAENLLPYATEKERGRIDDWIEAYKAREMRRAEMENHLSNVLGKEARTTTKPTSTTTTQGDDIF